MNRTIGSRIRDARKNRGLTQLQLAELIGAKNTAISNWEKDINKPDVDTIELLCTALDVHPVYFFPVDTQPQPDDSPDEYAFLDNMTVAEIADRCYQDFKIMFSLSSKATPEQMKGFYIDAAKRFGRD